MPANVVMEAEQALNEALSGVERDEARKALRDRFEWYRRYRSQREADEFAVREKRRYQSAEGPDLENEIGLPALAAWSEPRRAPNVSTKKTAKGLA